MDFFLRCVRSTWEVVVAAQTKLNWRRNCHFHTTGDHLRLRSPMNDSEAGPSTGVTENFDVFLNHRGPDLKATFVAHLDEALRFEGFRPFLDRLSLREGNPNQESIYQALDMAKVHVAIVSKGYAESEYCLNELVAIMNSGKPVIPVFYGVEPNDLRWVKKRKFAKAFEKHEGRQTPKKLQEWTAALGWLAGISGFCFDTTCKDRDEAKLKQDVVDAVARNFPRALVYVDENRRVGLAESRKEVVRKLESGLVGVVGLYGMGGIGKTTLAEVVYEHCAQDFRHCSFLRDVRSSDPLTLQKQLMKDLRVGEEVSSRDEYQVRFQQFKDLKVLIVVDDIDDQRQFQEIIPDLCKIGKGSKIIVTSRDQRLLSTVLISLPEDDMPERESSVLHEVEQLNSMQSRQLFNVRAFGRKSPDCGFEDLAEKVADACSGHPLALEVTGSFLRRRKNLKTDIVYWNEMIAWKATRDEKVQSILKTSYEKGLNNCQRTMFLDIACLLIGEPKAVALEIWASCGSCGCEIDSGVESSLLDLMEKCLVKLNTDGRLRMHDVLRDMGREIVDVKRGSELGKRTHFWDPNLADAVLGDRKGSNKVRGFSIAKQWGDAIVPTYDAEAFSEMSELHLLVLDRCRVSGDFSKWSSKLRLLQWRFSPLSELPSELNLKKTVVVDLSYSVELTGLWKDETPLRKAWSNLRRLILNNCKSLTSLPQDIGKRLSKLKVLELGRCARLESLPDSIGETEDLEQLILYMCGKLRSIPDTVGRLKKLKHLDLSYCLELEILPNALVNLGTLTALETLQLVSNKFITELPESFTGLISLVHLNMSWCWELRTVKALPRSLRHLHLRSCWKLDHLPSFEGLTSLATLTLCKCQGLKEIRGLDCLTTLEEVNLAGCTSMQPPTLQLQHNRALRSCSLRGSNVALKYDSDWSESEPALQLITYYDDEFGSVDDEFGLVRRVSAVKDCDEVCMEAPVLAEKCVSVVIYCVADDHSGFDNGIDFGMGESCTSPCFLDVVIVREGQEVFWSRKLITVKSVECGDQVYLCTLRRTHPLVRDLKLGDKIQVVARSEFSAAITVKHGAIYVVNGQGEDQVISVNSRLLDVKQSQEKRAQFAELILKGKPECPASSERENSSE